MFMWLASQNFNYFFNLFHSVFFKTGTWVFPTESLSIKLFPIELFQGFAKNILTKISLVSLFLLLIGMGYRKFYSFLQK